MTDQIMAFIFGLPQKTLNLAGKIGDFFVGITDKIGGLLIDFGRSGVHFFITSLMLRLAPAVMSLFYIIGWGISQIASSFSGAVLGNFLAPIWPGAEAAISATLFNVFLYTMGTVMLGALGYTLFTMIMGQYQSAEEDLKEHEGKMLKNLIRYGQLTNHNVRPQSDEHGNLFVQGVSGQMEDIFHNTAVISHAREALHYIVTNNYTLSDGNLFGNTELLGPERRDGSRIQLLRHYVELFESATSQEDRIKVLDNFSQRLATLISAGTFLRAEQQQHSGLTREDVENYSAAYNSLRINPFVLSKSKQNWTHFAKVTLPTMSWIPMMVLATVGYSYGLPGLKAYMGYTRWDKTRQLLGLITAGGASTVNFVANTAASSFNIRSTAMIEVERWSGENNERTVKLNTVDAGRNNTPASIL